MGVVSNLKSITKKKTEEIQRQQEQNRKSTDTIANSQPKQSKAYYRKKSQPTYNQSQPKPKYRKAKQVNYKSKKPSSSVMNANKVSRNTKASDVLPWQVNIDLLNALREEARPELYDTMQRTPLYHVTEDSKPGSDYKMRKWIRSMKANRTEDKGNALQQAKRLAQLYAAIRPTTKGYTKEQSSAIHRQAQNMPVELQNLFIANSGKLRPIMNEPNLETAYYQPGGTVHANIQEIAKDSWSRRPYRTHWHEYGHNLDWLSGPAKSPFSPDYSTNYTNNGESFYNTVSSDLDSSMRDYWTRVAERDDPYDPKKALSSFHVDMAEAYPYFYRNSGEISDMASPYSVSVGGSSAPFGAGHAAEYWQNDRMKNAEAFANLTSASVYGGMPLEFVQAIYPNTYDVYLEMLRHMKRR